MHARVTSLRDGDLVVTVDADAGARIRSLRHDGDELLVTDGRPPFGNHCFVMAPYAGRVRDGIATWDGRRLALPLTAPPHAMHGCVHDRPWDPVDDPTPASGTWRTRIPGDEWFAPLVLTQRVAVTATTVTLHLDVDAPDGPTPATVGWHPWFRRSLGGHEVAVELPDASALDRGDDHITTRERIPIPDGPLDHTLVDLAGPVRLTWGQRLRVTIDSDADATVVYTAHPLGVCVEPQTGPPDEVNVAPRLVTPDRPLSLTATLTIER